MITDEVISIDEHDEITIFCKNDKYKNYNSVILCTGGIPKENNTKEISKAFSRREIRDLAERYDGVRIVGASHTGMFILRNIWDLGIPIELYGKVITEDQDPFDGIKTGSLDFWKNKFWKEIMKNDDLQFFTYYQNK